MKRFTLPSLLLAFALLITSCLDTSGPDVEEYDDTADLLFLEENKLRDGVFVTESGLQYRLIEEGDGVIPTEESIAIFDFIGTFVDGEEFNNTFDNRNSVIARINSLPPGLSEGILFTNIGATYEFVLPPELAYGNNSPGAVLIFELKLLHSTNYDPIFLEENAQNEDITVTESGLQYRVIEEGTGDTPASTSNVSVEYTGTLIYGETFDTSRDTDEPVPFDLNRVITGFSEGIQLMKEGARYEFFIPAELAYGDQPPQSRPNETQVHPGATLIFDVELISVNN